MACDNVAIPIQSLDQIYRVKADGTGQAALIQPTDASATAWAANQDYPVFSADDSKVIFADDGSGTMQLYTVDLASGAVAQITHLAGSDSVSRAPFVSASTGLVYFTRSGTSDGGTYMAGSLESIHIDGTGEQTVLTIPHAGGDMAAYAMAWSDFALSPDESQLVFWSFVFVSDSGWNYDCTYAITTSTLTGGSLKTLTTATLYDAEYPAWH
jgi:Tol biopolymer transport system component